MRLAPDDRALLDALCEHAAGKGEGESASAADVLRALVRREAKRLRLAS